MQQCDISRRSVNCIECCTSDLCNFGGCGSQGEFVELKILFESTALFHILESVGQKKTCISERVIFISSWLIHICIFFNVSPIIEGSYLKFVNASSRLQPAIV